jgi:hypothetical protein
MEDLVGPSRTPRIRVIGMASQAAPADSTKLLLRYVSSPNLFIYYYLFFF